MLRLSSFLLVSLFISNVFAIDVVITNENINYNEFVTEKMVKPAIVKKVKKHCIPATLDDFKTKKLQATHYMRKGFVICQDDIKEYEKESVLFNFGTIQIEKHGEIIFENDDYIRIKKNDGDIEKIYKDGRIK